MLVDAVLAVLMVMALQRSVTPLDDIRGVLSLASRESQEWARKSADAAAVALMGMAKRMLRTRDVAECSAESRWTG